MRILSYILLLFCFLAGSHYCTPFSAMQVSHLSSSQSFQKTKGNVDAADTGIQEIDLDFGEDPHSDNKTSIPDKLFSGNLLSLSRHSLDGSFFTAGYFQKCNAKPICIANYSAPIYIKLRVLRI